MAKKVEKTNVMRLLDAAKIKYSSYDYSSTGETNGVEIAKLLSQDAGQVFKTLVTESKSKTHYVFVIPVESELDLKKAAAAANEKSISMIKQKELLPLTGYIHGGCSPIGMKKQFQTFIDESASNYDSIIFSAGKVGYQVQVSVNDLQNMIGAQFANLKA